MKLREILQRINRDIPFISYRTFVSLNTDDDTDIFAGACEYKDGEIISLDGDSYSLEDEISAYEYDKQNNILAVWYKSKWIRGK